MPPRPIIHRANLMHTIRPWLFIGKVAETSNRTTMYAYHIGAILQLAHPARHPGIETLYLPVADGIPLPLDHLARGVAFARAQKAAGHNLVIGCGAGISRSVTYTMAVLLEDEGISLYEAYEQILAVHPEAMPHFALIKSLGQYYHDPVSTRALLARVWLLDTPDL